MKNNVFRWALIVIALGMFASGTFAKYDPAKAKAKAKKKVIEYTAYKIEGYVYKKEFVSEMPMTVFTIGGDTLMSGLYSVKSDVIINSWDMMAGRQQVPQIAGIRKLRGGVIEGEFFIANSYKGTSSMDGPKLTASESKSYKSYLKSPGLQVVPLRISRIDVSGSWGHLFAEKDGEYMALQIDCAGDGPVKSIKGRATIGFGQVYNGYYYADYIFDWDNCALIPRDTMTVVMRNGDTFVGMLSDNLRINLSRSGPDLWNYWYARVDGKGKYAFASGEEIESEGYRNLSGYHYALERKKAAEAARQEQLRKEREAAERARQEKLARKQKAEERRKRLIAKYGKHYGTLLADKKLELGMTKAMVNEVYRKNLYSVSQYKGGVEVWTMGNYAGLMGGGFLGELVALGQLSMPRMLVFKNGKLIEIHRN